MDTEQQKKGIGLIPLAALVIGSAIGGGVLGTRRNSNVDALLVDQ